RTAMGVAQPDSAHAPTPLHLRTPRGRHERGHTRTALGHTDPAYTVRTHCHQVSHDHTRNDGGSTEPCEAGPSRDPPLICNASAILCNEAALAQVKQVVRSFLRH